MAITSYKAVVGYYNSAGTPNITTAVTDQLSDGWIPIGAPILTDAYGQCTQMMVKTDATPAITASAYTVVAAANPQPPDATWNAQGEPLWIDTATYLQAYTKGGAYLQGVVPVSRGGTGATNAAAARTNLQLDRIVQQDYETEVFAQDGITYTFVSQASWGCYSSSLGPIPLSLNYGGTGATNATNARDNLGLGPVATLSIIPVANGGTGSTNASDARDNLGLGSVATLNTVPVADGGTGATTVAEARTNLEVPRGTTVSDSTRITSPNVNSQAGVFNDGRFQTISGGTIRWGSNTGGALYSNYNAMKNTTELAAGNGAFYLPTFNVGDNFGWVSGFSMSKAVSAGYLTKLQLAMRHATNSQFADSGIHTSADNASNNTAEFLIRPADTNIRYTVASAGSQSQFTVQLNAVSDSRRKHDIEPTTVNKAWNNLTALQFVTFVYNNDEQKRTRRGIIAQQAETVDPLYVKTVEFTDNNGDIIEQKQLDTTPMLLDTMHVVQKLIAEIDALKAEVAFLKSGK